MLTVNHAHKHILEKGISRRPKRILSIPSVWSDANAILVSAARGHFSWNYNIHLNSQQSAARTVFFLFSLCHSGRSFSCRDSWDCCAPDVPLCCCCCRYLSLIITNRNLEIRKCRLALRSFKHCIPSQGAENGRDVTALVFVCGEHDSSQQGSINSFTRYHARFKFQLRLGSALAQAFLRGCSPWRLCGMRTRTSFIEGDRQKETLLLELTNRFNLTHVESKAAQRKQLHGITASLSCCCGRCLLVQMIICQFHHPFWSLQPR